MKIVQVEDFFHPNAGYQVNVLSKYMARDGHQVIIITSELDKIPNYLTAFFGKDNIEKYDKEFEETYHLKIIRLPIIRYISGRSIYKCTEVWNLISRIKPDILYLHGNDTYFSMRTLLNLKRIPCPVICDNHMVDMASVNKFNKIYRKFYKAFIRPKIVKNNIYVIRTVDDPYVEKRLGIPLKLAPVISLGTDTMLFHPDEKIKNSFRKQYSISDSALIVLFAGKLNESKGGQLLADVCCQEYDTVREVVFVIIGNTTGEYGIQIEDTFKKSNNRVLRFPTQKYTDLAGFYQAADIALIPMQCSMSIFDYSASGLPVVAEDNITNIERIVELGEGITFKSKSISDFSNAVRKYANMEKLELDKCSIALSETAKSKFGFDEQYKKYMQLINKVVEGKN